ncbi:MAG: hypothetical protein JO154_24850 [Chitinophaga sp.]|uniref:hypothetical protein n=1 Tax=Chitinophaga sp. TaxID=1869181 RepID=UPI0025C307D1|nr:hypothetical protein [Chitinophaga sp.]MBV8255848.1 hypothetical protein [Chitinophaga sp.]
MHKRFWHKILAILLLGVFSFNTLPREFIHEFANHHDTHDIVHPVGKTTISSLHKHCDFLQIGIEPYEPFAVSYLTPVIKLTWIFQSPMFSSPRYQVHRDLSPRAPPVEAVTIAYTVA